MTLLARLGEQLPQRYYLGIDIGYKAHVAVVIPLTTFVQEGERWKRAACLEFPTTRAGLDKLQVYLNRFSPDPATFFGLCEPTGGFYGATVFEYLLAKHYPIWWIENATTRHMREKIFGYMPKTDEIDARVMARIGYLSEAVGEEFTLRTLHLAQPDDAELLALCRDSWKLTTMIGRARNQFAQLMAVVFPELKSFFTDRVSTTAPVSLIQTYPSPAELAAAPAEEVYTVLWQAGAYQHARRVDELQALARTSSGLLPDPGRAWRVAWLTDYLLSNFKAHAALQKQLDDRLSRHENYRYLVDMPYTGPATLGVIVAVTGNIQRFRNYRRYVAYTGYFAGLERSQTIDRSRMSNRGNRNLRRAYFQIAAPLVWFDRESNPYKTLFERKRAEGRAWYEAMPFVCAALARHVYHCLKFKEPYDAQKAFAGSAPRPASEQALAEFQATLDEQFEVMDAHQPIAEG